MKVFIADYIGLIYLEEAFLKKGHTVYLNINHSFNHKLKDVSELNVKYPNQLMFVEDKSMLDSIVPNVDFGIQYECSNPRLIDRVFKKYDKVLVHSKINAPLILEMDRSYAKTIDLGFNRYDVKTIASFIEFDNLNLKKRYVLKAKNEHCNKLNYNFRTVVTKNNQELREILKNDIYGHLKSGGAVLEEYINGVELCCGFYWSGKNIVADTVFINQEYKAVLDGNRSGVMGGESGTVIVPMHISNLPIKFKTAVMNLQKYLSDNYPNYHGFVDFNTMIKGNKVYLLEFTIRAGIPTEYEIAYIVEDYPEFIRCVATGDTYKKKIKGGIYTFACLYPYGYPITSGRNIFIKLGNKVPKNMIPVFYKYAEDGVYYFECDRAIAFAGCGSTIEDSIKDCYEALHKWDDNNLIYRTDIGCNFSKAYEALLNLK